MPEKNYVASSIKKITTQYGELFNANFKMEDLQKIVIEDLFRCIQMLFSVLKIITLMN